MFDCHKKLNSFFDDSVRLKEKHDTLRNYRDKNLERLRNGTAKLSEKDKETHPTHVENFSQGSMAMFTINQAQNDDDHDIDHAIVYEETDIHSDPQDARDFVANAIKEDGGNFKVPPEAKTNAVTITYQDGYHVDFAIYKRVSKGNDEYDYFHAGESWTRRDPKAINEWFNNATISLSPTEGSTGVSVSKNQLRRIVRLFKFWAKSRSDWSMPGGLVLTTLMTDNYVKDDKRDDISFYETLKKINSSLLFSTNVTNPADRSLSLIITDNHKKQISSLTEKLSEGLNHLSGLEGASCNEEKAFKCWKDFFDNAFWTVDTLKKAESINALDSSGKLSFKIMITTKSVWGSNKYEYKPNTTQTIPKKASIRFELTSSLPAHAEINWEVQNRGDEAKWDNQISPRPGAVDQSNRRICNESTRFRGNHTMKCTVAYDQTKIVEHIPVRIR